MYKEWLKQIEKVHDTSYHANLLKYANDILNDVGRRTQKQVADDLQLKASHFSLIKPLLLAYTELQDAC